MSGFLRLPPLISAASADPNIDAESRHMQNVINVCDMPFMEYRNQLNNELYIQQSQLGFAGILRTNLELHALHQLQNYDSDLPYQKTMEILFGQTMELDFSEVCAKENEQMENPFDECEKQMDAKEY